MASVSAISVIVSAGRANAVRVTIDRSGDDSGGQPLGMGATILRKPPRNGSDNAKCPIALPTRTPTSKAGMTRLQGRHRTHANAVAMQVTSAVGE